MLAPAVLSIQTLAAQAAFSTPPLVCSVSASIERVTWRVHFQTALQFSKWHLQNFVTRIPRNVVEWRFFSWHFSFWFHRLDFGVYFFANSPCFGWPVSIV
jgi:hypothetical protein